MNVVVPIDDAWAEVLVGMNDDVVVVFTEELDEIPLPNREISVGFSPLHGGVQTGIESRLAPPNFSHCRPTQQAAASWQ